MKKLLCLVLIFCLCAALSACDRRDSGDNAARDGGGSAPQATAVPEEGSHGEADQSQALETMPTLEPAQPREQDDGADSEEDFFDIDALVNRSIEAAGDAPDDAQAIPSTAPAPVGGVVDPNTYQYSALMDNALGFTFNYPSHWVNVPGVYTICFREPQEEGKFPARVAITVKNLVHTPDETAMTEQMTAYMRVIHKQYESSTFESGTPNMQDTFMGKPALSNTYLAFSGDTEVKGFVIGATNRRTMCVFHFCASYEDYTALESVMRYMLNSVKPVETE